MGARFRSWWQQIKKHRVAIGVTTAIIVVAVALIIVGYWFDVTGFNGYTQVSIIRTLSGPTAGTVTRTEAYQPGKTLWDWLQLLIVPIVLALGATLFNRAITHNEQKIADQRYVNEQHIALDKQREDLLQVYLDRMSDLLLNGGLLQSSTNAEVRNIARVRTLTVLRQLDNRRKNYVLSFLRETKLVTSEPETNIISFSSADLSRVDLKDIYLSDIDLSKANLSNADLTGAELRKVNLSEADLTGANMSNTYITLSKFNRATLSKGNFHKAYLEGVSFAGDSFLRTHLSNANFSESIFFKGTLRGARLTNADLREVELVEVDLREASLAGAKLNKANLSRANLSGAKIAFANLNDANLSKADLTNADFGGANLDGADLSGATVDVDELEQTVKSLKGATMPDGKIHP
jgi:uncharacterized protein YjbI with pentapeptide repeats